jgi:hypothetical protein
LTKEQADKLKDLMFSHEAAVFQYGMTEQKYWKKKVEEAEKELNAYFDFLIDECDNV